MSLLSTSGYKRAYSMAPSENSKSSARIKAALEDLYPSLNTVKSSYKAFIRSEKEKIEKTIQRLEALQSLEYVDDVTADSTILEMLSVIYPYDSEEMVNSNAGG